MKDATLGERFRQTIRRYGGVALDSDEEEALKLQPNFAIYEEVNKMEIMASTEKAFTAIR